MRAAPDNREHVNYPYFMDVESVRLITFDCYGTLIDWETGMLRRLASSLLPQREDGF